MPATRLSALARAMRPRHWLKNGFVLAPAVFAGHAFDPEAMLRVGSVAFAFCLVSSAGYLVNDVLDREADRQDPVKCRRPVASGELAPAAALMLSTVLFAAAVAITVAESWPVTVAVLAYAGLTTLYSLFLKTVPVIEAMTLATGFLIRLAAGALAVAVAISHWLVICGFLLALLLAFSKRVPEASHPAVRTPVYPASYLQDVVNLLAGVTLVAYTLYTVAPDTVAKVGSQRLLLTVPFVLFGILRYLLLLHREGAQDPTSALVADRPLLLTVVLWTATAGAIVYFGGGPK
jgi:4-hydroxybenzoate polyprenyltransferase